MKKINLLIAGMLLAGIACSQDYVPMAVDQAHWLVALKDKESPMPYEYLWHYYSWGDTTVDGKVYKKVYKQMADTFSTNEPPYTPFGPITLLGLLRDDAGSRLVYGICYEENFSFECPPDEEFLLYEFSLQVGDSMNFCLAEPYYASDTIAGITQGQFYGVDTRIFTMAVRMNNYYEGIGSDFGLFEDMFDPLKDRELYHNYLYGYCRDNNCDLIVDVKENMLPEYYLKISPNPANEMFRIQCQGNDDPQNENPVTSMEIYNMLGEKIKSLSVPKAQNIVEIDASAWQSGMYVFRLFSDGRVVKSEKLLIK